MADEDYKARLSGTGRNDACPCGSGKKYKKCHLQADEESYSVDLARAQEKAAAEAAAEAAEAEGEEGEDRKEGRAHPPEGKRGKYEPKTPRPRPTGGSRQVSTPRKAGTS
jgi:hypothetical protein